MRARAKIEGLYLWEVSLTHSYSQKTILWITTRYNEIDVAANKAKAFIQRKDNLVRWPCGEIVNIKCGGTLDA